MTKVVATYVASYFVYLQINTAHFHEWFVSTIHQSIDINKNVNSIHPCFITLITLYLFAINRMQIPSGESVQSDLRMREGIYIKEN